MNKFVKTAFSSLLFLVVALIAQAQEVDKSTIILEKVVVSETNIKLQSITNNSSKEVKVSINGKEDPVTLGMGEHRVYNRECRFISVAAVGGSGNVILWTKNDAANEWQEMLREEKATGENSVSENSIADSGNKEGKTHQPTKLGNRITPSALSQIRNKKIDAFMVISSFRKNIESDSYYSKKSIEELKNEIDRHIECLKNWVDKNAYKTEQHLSYYLNKEKQKVEQHRMDVPSIIKNFMDYYDGYEIVDRGVCSDSLQSILIRKLDAREAALGRLENAMADDSEPALFSFDILAKMDRRMLYNCLAIIAVCVLLVVWFIMAKRKKRKRRTIPNKSNPSTSDDSASIVVRRKTTSILKKQSLEDVTDNKAYMKIECSDFCSDSAVRRIYIKNTCIKDIYNMYAEDLRNPDNPKEDGCMVLGRWVHDEQDNEYYVSLEYIVQPGDDAVFQEYELNFGGKIKLKVAEKLRKLRRETNLQYDLTCWVHSHPGLGVFFSNSDSNVQMQLKHPTHPNFLTAMVIDILTPQQEMGIFTFKRDSSINSKMDLKKMYSLEELYKWAVDSDRYSYKAEDHYNSLAKAELHLDECYGIQLSNGAIIDMNSLTTGLTNGLVGWVHGFPSVRGNRTEYVVVSVTKSEVVPDNELLGCFVIGTHCSIPSIRKAIFDYIGKIKFVFFYSTTDGMLTTIPLSGKQLGTDEKYYGEEKLDELKIWTRRKR